MCRFPHKCKGLSVPMHSNALSTGRGAYFKAPDWAVAAGCNDAHDYIDGRKGGWTLEEKRANGSSPFTSNDGLALREREAGRQQGDFMSMLKPASNKQAFAKVGIYGNAGSGKTYTAALIAIGLHQHAKARSRSGCSTPSPRRATSSRSSRRPGIPFLVYDESARAQGPHGLHGRGRARVLRRHRGLRHARMARHAGVVHREDQRGARAQKQEADLQARVPPLGPDQGAWAKFTDRYLSSKLHVIVCGRAGSIYEYQTNEETGKKELITTGTRMATEKEMGYEPSLLIEMVAGARGRQDDQPRRRHQGSHRHAERRRDRLPRTSTKLKSHFAFLNLGGEHYESMERATPRRCSPRTARTIGAPSAGPVVPRERQRTARS
jgi:hypothetical protein